jgi:hypothetical protein
MTFPVGTVISTANLDSSDDDPSLARADLYAAVVALNQLIASANAASGVLILNGSAKIAAAYLPGTYAVTGGITLQPSSGVVSLQRVLRLQQTVVADLGTVTGTASPTAGDLVFLTDGDAGSPCLACYDGTKWCVVRLMTQAGSVGASLTATSTLTAEADA